MAGTTGRDSLSLSDSTTTTESSSASSRFLSYSSQSEVNDMDSSSYVSPVPRSASHSPRFDPTMSKNSDPSDTTSGLASKAMALGSAASATGQKLKRVLNVRRKKHAEDQSPPNSSISISYDSFNPLYAAISNSSAPSPISKKGLNLHLSGQVFRGSKRSISPDLPSTPPPLPPKLTSPPHRMHSLPLDGKLASVGSQSPSRNSLMTLSPAIAGAVQYMNQESLHDTAADSNNLDKESWRKSDSTMSHRTVRPTTTVGSRTPRPGSIVATVEEGVIPQDEAISTPTNTPKPPRSTSFSFPAEFTSSGEPLPRSPPMVPGGHSKGSSSEPRGIPFSSPPSPYMMKEAPSLPNDLPHHRTSLSSSSQASTRSAASSSFAPAVGLAKRAVERMGRAWLTPPSSFTGQQQPTSPGSQDLGLNRIESNQSSAERKKYRRRTPNTASGTWSVGSSTHNSSESDGLSTPVGPYLGNMMRNPINTSGGVVFGRDLRSVVRYTAMEPTSTIGSTTSKEEYCQSLETRCLPAVVIRCGQHLAIWGVQEEGLFRVNGRPSHVTKIRSEFDTGADYNMMECSPSELDPHAVAGVFKAFLRELPEPILTHALSVYFDAAVAQESEVSASSGVPHAKIGGRGPTLPSGPRAGLALRKPPSLSTLAMPDLHSMRKPSSQLIQTLRSLIARLPLENRDLLKTVVDLIRQTSKESKVTKMPLSNLLVVFCPSLHMNPPLLRVLAECDEIWDGCETPAPTTPHANSSPAFAGKEATLNIRRTTLILETPETPEAAPEPELTSDAFEESNSSSTESSSHSPISPSPPLIDVHSPKKALRVRPIGPRKQSPTSQCNDDFTHDDAEITFEPTTLGGLSTHNPSEESVDSGISPVTESVVATASSSMDFWLPNPSLGDTKCLTMHTSPSAPVLSPLLTTGPPSHSIPFPTTKTPSHLSPRRSFPTLSLLGIGGSSYSLETPTKSPLGRTKRPSLNFLLPKRSPSPLNSTAGGRPFISSPITVRTSPIHPRSISSPIPIDGPTSSPHVPILPPVLDSPTASGNFGFSLSFDTAPEGGSQSPGSSLSTPLDSPISVNGTPIANLYKSPINAAEESFLPPAQPRSVPGRSGMNHIDLSQNINGEEDDWTRTVILAVDASITSE